MKKIITFCIGIALLASCQTVRVTQDFDPKANFGQYKSFAFYKEGIDKAEISDLDKKRILYALDEQMTNKGFVKSATPDIMINIFTDSKERVNVYNNWGWGFGWGWGWGWGGFGGPWGNQVSTTIEGVLHVDFIDAKTKQLIWQGVGKAPLKSTTEGKTQRTNEMVARILEQYPPMPEK